MNRRQWPNSNDPDAMLDYLGGGADRRLRLFACACVRRVWHLLDDDSRNAVLVAEAFADGRASATELQAAAEAAGDDAHYAARNAASEAQSAVRQAAGNQQAAEDAERAVQADLLRCVFGPDPRNPPPAISPAALAGNAGAVRSMASAIYGGRCFDRLAVLADALEEVGVTEPAILDHCRGPGPHARGCFVLDLILRPEA